MFTSSVLARIGEAHGKSVAQVVLRWLIQCGVVVIPKTVNPGHMAQNFEVFDFELIADEMTQIHGLDTANSQFFNHADPAMVRRLSRWRVG